MNCHFNLGLQKNEPLSITGIPNFVFTVLDRFFILALLFTSCVTLGKSINISELKFTHLLSRDNDIVLDPIFGTLRERF